MRVAFVVQRYGLEVNGGAELHCRWVAEHLSHHLDVEVITTCAIDYDRWANEYPSGSSELNGVRVHRFVVDRQRNPRRFLTLTTQVLKEPHNLLMQLEWMQQQGPLSSSLQRFIASERENYDAFIFFTYLYASTYYGIQLVPNKALLVPEAHDEPMIYLDIFRAVFNLPRYIIFNTEVERQTVQRVFANERIPATVLGTGVDVPLDVQADRFRVRHNLNSDFVIYAGRIEQTKNVHELIDYFMAFRASSDRDLKLVLMGKGSLPIPKHPDVLSLGFVSEQDKFDGMRAASVLIMPSRYESLSIALLDAWRVGTPVLVNGDCEVLQQQCRLAQGGLWYQSHEEFDLALRLLLDRPDLRRRLAESGRAYTEKTYAWDRIENSYLEILEQFDR
jgi:glycosyltransferase involved in cell wall biosynthesis